MIDEKNMRRIPFLKWLIVDAVSPLLHLIVAALLLLTFRTSEAASVFTSLFSSGALLFYAVGLVAAFVSERVSYLILRRLNALVRKKRGFEEAIANDDTFALAIRDVVGFGITVLVAFIAVVLYTGLLLSTDDVKQDSMWAIRTMTTVCVVGAVYVSWFHHAPFRLMAKEAIEKLIAGDDRNEVEGAAS